MINILLYVVENGCKWRALPKEFGNWHTVYMRMSRWAKSGVLLHLFQTLQSELQIKVDTSVLSLDSSCIKVHPDGTGSLKKTENNPSEKHAATGNARWRIRTAVRWVMVRKSSRSASWLLLVKYPIYHSNPTIRWGEFCFV